MAIEKSAYQAPIGDMNLNIGGPKSLKGTPMQFEVNAPLGAIGDEGEIEDEVQEDEYEHFENIAAFLDEKMIQRIGNQCKMWFEKDKESRAEWEATIQKGIQNLGMNVMDSDDDDAPFEGACMAVHPLILEAAVKFQSKATAELLPASGPVRTEVMGAQTEPKLMKANRVKEYMNFQITKQMTEYYPDMEKLLFHLPLYGSAFKKTYWDFNLNRPVSCFIPAQDFVINNNQRSLEKARRYTEILPIMSGSELRNKVINGEFIEPKEWRGRINLQDQKDDITGDSFVGGSSSVVIEDVTNATNRAAGMSHVDGTFSKEFSLCEQHCFLSLPRPFGQSGFTDPYIVTFIRDTGEILSIRRNWDEDSKTRAKIIWFSHYLYVPSFGFYGAGLFHLLGNFQVTLTSIIRSLVDAGQFANLQGGLKLKGLRITGDNSAIAPGEWRETESPIQDISKALFPLPYKEPSQVLLAMLQWLDGRAGSFADSTEQVVSDSTNYGPVGTTVALLEASMKLFSAIHKRIHYSQEQDLKLLARVNHDYMPDEYPYDVSGGERNVFKSDFDPKVVDVIPVSDPNVTSNAHRLSLAQTKLQAALQSPNIHNLKKVYRNFYLALGEENIDEFMTPDTQAAPLSPLEDIITLNDGKPIKAFPGQDHKAHVEFKSTWLMDPVVGGQSPTMQQFVPLVQANIREHQLMQLSEQIGGMVNQVPGADQDPKLLAQIQAQAAAEVFKANQALAASFGSDEPMQMIAQAELMKATTEKDRVAHVKTKDLADLSIKAQKVDIDRFEAMLKSRELGINADVEQFKNGLHAVKLGLDNLMREADGSRKDTAQRDKKTSDTQKLGVQLASNLSSRRDKAKAPPPQSNKKKK